MQRKGTRWRIDWAGEGSPEAGQLVRHVTPKGRCSYARVQSVRVVRNVRPLPQGSTCRYAITVERMAEKPAGEAVAWTCHAYAPPARRPRIANTLGSIDPSIDPWSPLR